jgi:malonyl-CoA O-methyltransferase
LKACEAYAKWAATFDAVASPIVALETRVLAPRMPSVAGKRVVDIGCGTGRWIEWSVARGGRAVGVDLSGEMLACVSRKWGCVGRVAIGDGMRAPVRGGCADIVISMLAIGHLRPVPLAMAEMARIAAAGGLVIVTDFHPDALRRGWKRTFKSGGETVEVASEAYEISELCDSRLVMEDFCEAGFGLEERSIFEAAGKAALFDEVRGLTAIYVARFRKMA